MASVKVPVAKAKGEYLEVDTDAIPAEMWTEIVLQGLKSVLARGMSKISKTTYPVEAELATAAVAKAKENLEAVMANDTKKIRLSGSATKSTSHPREVQLEAMRIARNLIKDEIRKSKQRISDYKASEISTFAKGVLETRPDIYKQAEAAIAARTAIPTEGIDLSGLKADPVLVAKSEAKKKGDGTLSAKQAGKTKQRPPAKPKPDASLGTAH